MELETSPEVNDTQVKMENEPQLKYTFDDAIEKLGFGGFQVYVVFVSGFFWFFDGVELTMISYLLNSLKAEWDLSPLEAGFIGSMEFMGMLLGSFVGGLSGDHFGRKLFYVFGVFLGSGFGFLSSIAPNYYIFLVLRFLTGFGIGSTISSDTAIIAEYMPMKHRGWALSITNLFQGFGRIFVIFFSWLFLTVLPQSPNSPFSNWRYIVVICSLPGFIVFLLRILVPESPRYLLSKNQSERVKEILKVIAKYNRKQLPEGELIVPPKHKEKLFFENIPKLFANGRYTVTTLLIWVIFFCLSYGDWGLSFITPSVFSSVARTPQEIYRNGLLLTIPNALGQVISSATVNLCRRKWLFVISFLGCALTSLLLCFWNNPIYVIILFCLENFVSSFAWTAIYVYIPEFYATELRSTGFGIGVIFNRIGGSISFSLSSYLLGVSLFWPFAFFATAFLVAAFASVLLPTETKGRKLDDFVPNRFDQVMPEEDDSKTLLLDESQTKTN